MCLVKKTADEAYNRLLRKRKESLNLYKNVFEYIRSEFEKAIARSAELSSGKLVSPEFIQHFFYFFIVSDLHNRVPFRRKQFVIGRV